MKTPRSVRNTILCIPAVSMLCLLILSSCKKDKKELIQGEKQDTIAVTRTPAGTRAQLSADSLFLYAKEVYLWNESLPTYEAFNPRQYVNSDEETGLNSELFALTRYAKNTSGQPYEYNTEYPDETKYSYIFNTDNANPVSYVIPAKSSVDLDGNGYDFGLQVDLFKVTSTAYDLRVEAVFKGSPADKAGIKRGDVIKVINGRQVATDYTQSTVDFLNAALFDASTITMQLYRLSNNTTFNSNLAVSAYRSNPVYCDTVYTTGSKKVGYLAFARFSTLENAQSVLDEAFSKFATASVTDLIIDFRYNGGGYISTAEHLANLIVPSSKSGQLMYKETYNSLMQSNKATILKNQPLLDANGKLQYERGKLVTYADISYSENDNLFKFAKAGSLSNVQKVVFIVTGSTASASELVINSLKPYISDLKLVGKTSYGKPVGFFPVTIDKYEVYYSMFETRNANNEGGYYSGMTPDFTTSDDSRYDFGDLRESSTASAYNYLVNGSFTSPTAKTASVSVTGAAARSTKVSSFKPVRQEFKGMIEDRQRIRK